MRSWALAVLLTACSNEPLEPTDDTGADDTATDDTATDDTGTVDTGADDTGEVGPFAFGGTVQSLAGASVTLASHTGETVQVTQDGDFAFADLPQGTIWSITVSQQPSEHETCSVAGSTGIVSGAPAIGAVVTCLSDVLLAGDVTGLVGSGLVLAQGSDELAVTGPFVFPRVTEGHAYEVEVATPPSTPSQTCEVSGGSGLAGEADVTLSVACTTDSFSIGGSATGVRGQVVLTNNDSDALTLTEDGAFTFDTALSDLSAYSVEIDSTPADLSCSLEHASGDLAGQPVTHIALTCVDLFQVRGTATGGDLTGLVLLLDGGESLPINAPGAFAFTEQSVAGTPFTVTFDSRPAGQRCWLEGATGSLSAATEVRVTCGTPAYTVTAQVQDLYGEGLVLSLVTPTTTEQLPIDGDGDHLFTALLVEDEPYTIAVAEPSAAPAQACTPDPGTGSATANVVTQVACAVHPIRTAQDFQDISLDADGVYAVQNDVVFTDYDLVPIADFGGWLFGNGYTFHDLSVAGGGVFVQTDGAYIEHLTLQDFALTGDPEAWWIGGLVGHLIGSTLVDVHLQGRVDLQSLNFEEHVGGLVGEVDTESLVQGCSADLVFVETAEGAGSNAVAGGGLVGVNRGTIEDSFALTEMTHASWGNTGGFVGQNSGTIRRCWTEVDLVGAKGFSGGFVGINNAGHIADSYVIGSVANAGRSAGFTGEHVPATSSLQRVYAATTLSGANQYGLAHYLISGTDAVASYWDSTLAPVTSHAGVGKTTAQLQQQATFVGWDFTTVWSLDEGNGYPSLRAP